MRNHTCNYEWAPGVNVGEVSEARAEKRIAEQHKLGASLSEAESIAAVWRASACQGASAGGIRELNCSRHLPACR